MTVLLLVDALFRFVVEQPKIQVFLVAKLLASQRLSGDVDDLEPVELLAVCAAAHVDHQFVAEDVRFLVGREVVEVEPFVREAASWLRGGTSQMIEILTLIFAGVAAVAVTMPLYRRTLTVPCRTAVVAYAQEAGDRR